MINPVLYVDSSVVGGYFDEEWQEATRELWRQRDVGRWVFVTSAVTAAEMLRAPRHVRDLFEATFPADKRLRLCERTEALAGLYLEAGVVPRKYSDDARHVAACALSGCLILVSWNFRHLANVSREAGFNAVNLLNGYPSLRIVSPLEVIYEEDPEDI
jgi:hypothetical protein